LGLSNEVQLIPQGAENIERLNAN